MSFNRRSTMKATLPKLHGFIIFEVLVLLLAYCPVAFAALEKSSKKECAMCHVMWLDVFRTNKETLIKWQPGNVLMKDTQGIVSSEEVCYSCHDGYVADSRYVVWKGNSHTTFKKPSKNIRVPDALTLSNKGEIYCGTCHSPHSGREAPPGASPEETIPGPRSFLKLPDTDSSLCEACHVNEADYKRTHGHPVHTDKLKIPDTLFAMGSVKAKKKDTVTCQTCHKVHGAQGRNLTVIDNSGSALCTQCHKERSITGTPHDARLTMPDETNIKGQTVSESGPCGACHVPHNSAGYKLWARKTAPGNPASRACLSCHTGKPDSKIKGIGRYSHPIDSDTVSKENQKIAKPLTDKLPLFSANGAEVPSGSVQCFTCHNVHQWNPNATADRGGKDAKGNAANSFLRISSSKSSDLCVDCHQDKKQLLAHDHNLALTAPEAKNIRGDTAEVSGPCGACHVPHNAAGSRLWAREISKDTAAATQYCKGCHSENGVAKEKQVGKNDHPVDVVLKGSDIPAPDRVARELPLYNEAGNTKGGDRIQCRTCHDPHIWSPVDNKDAASEGPAVAATSVTANTEGDARNSFLRRVASPTPDLCIVCHEETALLVGTDHDLLVTAPTAKNRLGQTVAESGQCGVCHALHNSPEKRLLWAQVLGPVGENQHSMDGLCTGCHSKGGIAEDKIPPTATHPAGKLITNIMTPENRSAGYIKLFDGNWEEISAGDLSCSSCHSFYRWDHRVEKPGLGINIEGDADTSFLRTSSDQTVCIDCHGETAIWRYTYFHSSKKREMLKGDRSQ